MLALITCHRGALRSSQIDQLELTGYHIFYIRVIYDFEGYCENSMGSGARMVQQVRGHYLIFNPSVEEFQNLLTFLALKNEQILHIELILLIPSDP